MTNETLVHMGDVGEEHHEDNLCTPENPTEGLSSQSGNNKNREGIN